MLENQVLGNPIWGKNALGKADFGKSMMDHDPFSKKVFLARDFGKVWKTKIEFHKSIQKSISNIRGGKHPCKKPSQSIGQQRIQPAKKPSKVQQKIDTNFKTTTGALKRAAKNGAAR